MPHGTRAAGTSTRASLSSLSAVPLQLDSKVLLSPSLTRCHLLITCIYAAIQLARLSGFSPIITTASKHNEPLLKSLGATHIIDRSVPLADLGVAVRAITSKPLKIAYDTVGTAETQNAAYDVIAPGGKLGVVLDQLVDEGKITPDKEIQHIWGSVHVPQHRELGKSLFAKLTDLLEAGDIKVSSLEPVVHSWY